MVDQPRLRSRPDDGDDWSDGRSERRSYRRPDQRLEQRLDQWMTAGRQLVDGVAGARPGSRASARGTAAAARPRLRPGDLGRWVENKIDWLLEDDEGWREPWQEPLARRRTEPASGPAGGPAGGPGPGSFARQGLDAAVAAPGRQPSRRQPLEAISRRATPLLPESRASAPAGPDQDWPDDASFSLNRWRREPGAAPSPREARLDAPAADSPAPGRAVPRSSRRRID